MTNILSKEERSQIVNSHKKSLAVNKYNITLSLLEENAKNTPDSASIASFNDQMRNINAQIAVLDTELESIDEEADPAN